MSVPSEESLPVEGSTQTPEQANPPAAAAPSEPVSPLKEAGSESSAEAAAQQSAAHQPAAQQSAAPLAATSSGTTGTTGKPAFRVQIGSLGDPNMARESRPRPNPTAINPPVPRFDQPTEKREEAEAEAAEKPGDKPGTARQRGESEGEEPTDIEKRIAQTAAAAPVAPQKSYPPPNISRQLTPEMEKELEEALGGMSLEDVISGQTSNSPTAKELEPEARVTGKVHSIHRDNLFVELAGQYQGVVSLRMFETPPEIGSTLELIVHRFNADDGLYELSVPGKAIEVADWSEIQEGSVVQATITGHNKGGLECTVSKIRGFIPVSQLELFRVEDLEGYVGQSFPAVVTEANPGRGNLILSRRALQEREREETRRKMLEELAVGQTHEGIVRSLQDFGAFVDLGGVDGLIHISQMAWERIDHPSQILALGQKVKVRIEKYDRETGKIGLSYREQTANPWNNASQNYPVGSRRQGKVTKVMQFGAFVKLEPGIEGMVHISEISWQRVARVSDVLKEGQEVEVEIVSVDMDKQRIGLSMKALETRPTPVDKAKELEEKMMDELETATPIKKKHAGPLKGGTSKASGGEKFGLNW
jgi:small subunit ribosomal protein S1